jgi:hypothetical protein
LTIVGEKFAPPDFKTLALSDKADADQNEYVVSRPSQLLEVAYAPLAHALQGRLEAPAYVFPYDWRYSVVESAQDLVQFVKRLQRKTIPSLDNKWDGRFDFAVHSMGGLVLRAFLAAWQRSETPNPLPLGQVVFIATPHLGSLDAAVALISGETSLFGGRKEMRKLARTFPSVYELLPRFPGAIVRGGAELDIFEENNWQRNTVEPDERKSGFDVQRFHLVVAKETLTRLPLPEDPPYNIPPSDQLVIFGNKPNSVLVEVEVGPAPDNWYNFDEAKKGPGDDVVPVRSALLDGVAAVEIHVDDVSYFHPLERGMAATDLHAFLPALDEVATVVGRFFGGERGPGLLPLGLPVTRYHEPRQWHAEVSG